MNILAIDTATEACSTAISRGSGEVVSRYEEPGRGHAERILAMVDAVLGEARLALGDLDAIAFGRGPGGFTGVRLAASVAQGLAFAARLPVVPVSDLRAVAQRALDGAPDARTVLVCADARMREVYSGCFRRGPHGLAEPYPGEPERVGSPDTVDLPHDAEPPVHGAGRGFLAYPQLPSRLEGRLVAIEGDLFPRATEMARLAEAAYAAGEAVAAPEAAPVYLRDDVARPPPSRP